jgi:two-component system response regulator FixJ
MSEGISIAIVDDDTAVLDALGAYFRGKGFEVRGFDSAERFLAAIEGETRVDCVVSDIRMPGMSGLDLARRVASGPKSCPVILITGHGDIDMAVSAIKSGVFDFLEKPFDEGRLLEAIRRAVANHRNDQEERAGVDRLVAQFNSLSNRQRQVMEHAAAGLSNKDIAARLNISPKTVENHRAWVMERMGAKNLAELVHQAIRIKSRM